MTTPHSFRNHPLMVLVGLIVLTGMTPIAVAQCQLQRLLASDGAGADRFGSSVAVSADTAVIGAPFDDDLGNQSGSAYVFETVAGVWTQTAKLNAADGSVGDGFGFSVAVSGDTALIGAFADDDLGNQSGSAYVFERIVGVWTQTTKLNAVDGSADDNFGVSVALSGNTAVIGAFLDDDLGNASGSAYVFERTAGVWTQTAKLTAADGAAGDAFGSSVALSGSAALIGAPFGNGPPTNSGSAYLFERVGGVWTQTAKLTASDGTFGDRFGNSVAVNGNTAVVGALFDDDLGDSSGSAYVFEKVAGVWTQTGKLTASDGATSDNFGVSVAVSMDTALIGARLDDDLGIDSGSAYVFKRTAGVWTQTAKLNAVDGAAGDGFGGSVALSGAITVIGAPFDDNLGSDSGSAYALPLAVNTGDDCNNNSVPDACDIASGTSTDCNGNLIPDDCETNSDSDGDGVIDVCDNCALPNPAQEDCNNNGIGDVCDIADATSEDCNANAIPDACDISSGVSTDCNGNLIPDDCETDGDGDGVIDDCDNCTLPNPAQEDCNNNGIGDVCDISSGTSTDCNGNLIPDDCETNGDSDGDGVIDVCDNCALPNPGQEDCNNNSIGDTCDIADCTGSPLCSDCNGNAVPDECDVDPADPDGNGLVSPDCNTNGLPDECDLASSIDFVHQSGEFSPFNRFTDATEVIPSPPLAGGDVTLTVEVKADLDQSFEFVDVLLNGAPAGRLFESGGVQCPTTFDTGSLVIAAATFNALLPGDVTAKLTPSSAVDACTGVVKLRLSYAVDSNNDCNANGVPDECDADTDGDGVIDGCDPCPLDNPDDTDGDGVCDTDDLCSGTPLGLLVELDGCTRPEGPCCFSASVCIDGNDRQTCEAFPGGVFQGEGLTCGDPDGDGRVGCSDGCPLDPAKGTPGVCGCGVPDDDEDFDGIADCKDRCFQTPFDVPVNVCGCEETGACCAAAGGCFDDIERSLCRVIAGFYQGDGSTCAGGCGFGDSDGDGDVDLADFGMFERCFTGSATEAVAACAAFDVDGCGSIDRSDFQTFRRAITGP